MGAQPEDVPPHRRPSAEDVDRQRLDELAAKLPMGRLLEGCRLAGAAKHLAPSDRQYIELRLWIAGQGDA